MAISMSTVAYGAVILGGLVLFSKGHPVGKPPPSPTTPGLAIAATTPVAATAAPSSVAATVAPSSVAATAAPSPDAAAAAPSPDAAAAAPSPDAATAAPSSVAAAGFTLTSTAVELPVSDHVFPAGQGPAGQGREVAQQNCTSCHSVGMVMNQPNLPTAAWDGEVHKMLTVYKAPIDPADVPAIVAYLASIKGTR